MRNVTGNPELLDARVRVNALTKELIGQWAALVKPENGAIPLEIVLSARIEAHERYLEETYNEKRVVLS